MKKVMIIGAMGKNIVRAIMTLNRIHCIDQEPILPGVIKTGSEVVPVFISL